MNKVIILLGPTGVGKTKASIILAKALKTEIISADSMLVYRHMDIGTAKPSDDELKSAPHHLINILDPDQRFSAGLFKEKATEITDRLHGGNKIPLIVGGTGLYIRALTKGLFEGPDADDPARLHAAVGRYHWRRVTDHLAGFGHLLLQRNPQIFQRLCGLEQISSCDSVHLRLAPSNLRRD